MVKPTRETGKATNPGQLKKLPRPSITAVRKAAKVTPARFEAKAAEKIEAKRKEHKQVRAAVSNAKTAKKTSRAVQSQPRTRMLTAEYFLAIVLAIVGLFYGDATYEVKMKQFIVRLTGISALFFILALAGASERAAKPVIYFGALVDIGMIFFIFRPGNLATQPNAPEMKTLSEPYYVTHPLDVGQGDTSNPPPNSGTGKGNTGNATPPGPNTGGRPA